MPIQSRNCFLNARKFLLQVRIPAPLALLDLGYENARIQQDRFHLVPDHILQFARSHHASVAGLLYFVMMGLVGGPAVVV
ncbi:MAG: hypothetical protein MUP04_01055, partial [Anaerolineae bacterium]|nr:hypothetical protein [Anaerolineae bacterium]